MIAHLKKKGLYDNTIIVFTSDHGENLYDGKLDLGHGEHFRGEFVTRVPLIIKFHKGYSPSVRIKDYEGLLRQVDFAPTVMDLLGITEGGRFSGRSFRDAVEGKSRDSSRTGYSETGIWFVDRGDQFFQSQRIKYPDVSVLCGLEMPGYSIVLKDEYRDMITIAKHRAVFDREYKLIYIPTRNGVRYELYRMGDRELRNIYRPDHPSFLKLSSWLERYMKENEKARNLNQMYIPEVK